MLKNVLNIVECISLSFVEQSCSFLHHMYSLKCSLKWLFTVWNYFSGCRDISITKCWRTFCTYIRRGIAPTCPLVATPLFQWFHFKLQKKFWAHISRVHHILVVTHYFSFAEVMSKWKKNQRIFCTKTFLTYVIR